MANQKHFDFPAVCLREAGCFPHVLSGQSALTGWKKTWRWVCEGSSSRFASSFALSLKVTLETHRNKYITCLRTAKSV